MNKKQLKEGIYFDKKTKTYTFSFNEDDKESDLMNLVIKEKSKNKTYISNRKGLSVFLPYKFNSKVDKQTAKNLKSKIKNFSYSSNDDKRNLETMVKNALEVLDKKIDFRIDTILIPMSDAGLIKNIYEICKSHFPKVNVIDNSFIKNDLKNVKIDGKKIKNLDLNDEKDKFLYSTIKNGIKTGKLQMKKVPPMFRSLLSDYIITNPDNEDVIKHIYGNNVLIIDDYFTTGSSLNEMVQQTQRHNPSNVLCFVLMA